MPATEMPAWEVGAQVEAWCSESDCFEAGYFEASISVVGPTYYTVKWKDAAGGPAESVVEHAAVRAFRPDDMDVEAGRASAPASPVDAPVDEAAGAAQGTGHERDDPKPSAPKLQRTSETGRDGDGSGVALGVGAAAAAGVGAEAEGAAAAPLDPRSERARAAVDKARAAVDKAQADLAPLQAAETKAMEQVQAAEAARNALASGADGAATKAAKAAEKAAKQRRQAAKKVAKVAKVAAKEATEALADAEKEQKLAQLEGPQKPPSAEKLFQRAKAAELLEQNPEMADAEVIEELEKLPAPPEKYVKQHTQLMEQYEQEKAAYIMAQFGRGADAAAAAPAGAAAAAALPFRRSTMSESTVERLTQDLRTLQQETAEGKMWDGLDKEPAIALGAGEDYAANVCTDEQEQEFRDKLIKHGLAPKPKTRKRQRKDSEEVSESVDGMHTFRQTRMTRKWADEESRVAARKLAQVTNDMKTLRFRDRRFAKDMKAKTSRVLAEGCGSQEERLGRKAVSKVFVGLCLARGLTAEAICALPGAQGECLGQLVAAVVTRLVMEKAFTEPAMRDAAKCRYGLIKNLMAGLGQEGGMSLQEFARKREELERDGRASDEEFVRCMRALEFGDTFTAEIVVTDVLGEEKVLEIGEQQVVRVVGQASTTTFKSVDPELQEAYAAYGESEMLGKMVKWYEENVAGTPSAAKTKKTPLEQVKVWWRQAKLLNPIKAEGEVKASEKRGRTSVMLFWGHPWRIVIKPTSLSLFLRSNCFEFAKQ